MCNAAKEFFIPTWDTARISRSKLHKYLIRGKSDEKIFNEIVNGNTCVYQKTVHSEYSSLAIALARKNENVIKKLMEIYENDFKLLKENGFNNETAVLIAFGSDEIKFTENKLLKFSSDDEGSEKKFMILMKENNESPASLRIVTPKNEEEEKEFLKIVEKLYKNGTFDAVQTSRSTLFIIAASQGLIWVMEKLLEMGASHEVPNFSGTSPFEFACMNHQTETVKWFHKKFKIDLLKFMMEGNGLFSIASEGNFDTFDYIMNEIKRLDGDEHVQEIFNRRTEYHGHNILMLAANANQPDFIVKCLKFEPDLCIVDTSNCNLLHIVLRTYPISRDLANVLIKKQPNLLLMEDSNQWTPMHLLMSLNYLDELKSIYQSYPTYKNSLFKSYCDTPTIEKEKFCLWNETPGHAAFNVEDQKMVEFVIENHPEEFESSEYISGLLVTLIQSSDSVEIVKILQKLKNFNINVPDKNQIFPLFAALAQKKMKIFTFLFKSGDVKDINTMIDPWTKKNLLYAAIWNNAADVAAVPYGSVECTTVTHDVDSSGDEAEVFQPPAFNIPTETKPEVTRQEMFEVFKTLINCKVDFRHKAGNSTLLHEAVANDNLEVVEELLRLGLSVEELGEQGETPLHQVKSAEVFEALIAKVSNPDFINIKNEQGRTAFMTFVSLFGFSEVPVELFNEFIKHKADVKAADSSGYQPIHSVHTVEWIKVLLKNNADINAVTNEGENAAHLAFRNRNWKLAKFLLHETEIDRNAVTKNGISYITFVTAGDVNYREMFTGELKKVFDDLVDKHINEPGDYGWLINAFIRDGNLKMVQHPKADLHLKEADGQTCLHRVVAFKSSVEIAKYLVDRGLDVNAANESGITPLMMCIDYHSNDLADFFINQEKIDLNLSDKYGYSALHYAARSEEIEILCKLLVAGADPSITNNESKSFFDMLGDFNKKIFAFYTTKQ